MNRFLTKLERPILNSFNRNPNPFNMTSTQNLSSQIQDIISILETTPNTNISSPQQNEQELKSDQTDNNDNDNSFGGYDGKIKCPKGTRDYGPGDMVIREKMMTSIKKNLYKFGGQFMETPVFELRDVLMDKYGEDEKLIYDLAAQEAEPLCLRYDLTVPLARYVAQNRRKLKSPFKAARVGRVYRRDQPYMSKGRLREFWQCDFDIVRSAAPSNKLDLIFDDMEVIALTIQQLIDLLPTQSDGNAFVLLINNRKLLDVILDICAVPMEKMRAISSAIDKLDKKEWQCVKQEMIEKGINGDTAEMIRRFTEINGSPQYVLDTLKNDKYIREKAASMEVIEEFELLLAFLKDYNEEYMQYLRIDMSMVRGLDYYTGIIMEAQFADGKVAAQYGSIAGGGRYDTLVSRFVSSSFEQYPCCGSSLGFERIFSYLKNSFGVNVGVCTDVLICELSGNNNKDDDKYGLYSERLKLLNALRTNSCMNIEIMNKISPSFRDQINYAEQREIAWMCIIGEDEIKNDTINLRRLILCGDEIINNDGKRGIVEEIVKEEKAKWPKYRVKPINIGVKSKKKKDWILNKKQIKKIVQNGIEFDFQIKDLQRSRLIDFFNKIYNGSQKEKDN